MVHSQDRPRICGKHSLNNIILPVRPGSPPHMRETRVQRGRVCWKRRITPAYAGNTPPLGTVRSLFRDHPRICGKHLDKPVDAQPSVGSPPHMRETQIKDPIKSTFFAKQISKNIHFLREFKDKLPISRTHSQRTYQTLWLRLLKLIADSYLLFTSK